VSRRRHASGDNLVDAQTVAWIQAAIQARDANPTVLWIDEPAVTHKWRVPPVFMAALKACDVFINHSFDITIEEMKSIQEAATEHGVTLCRNFASTVGLLNSPWRRLHTSLSPRSGTRQPCPFWQRVGMPYEITTKTVTHLTGTIKPPSHVRFPTYSRRPQRGARLPALP